MNFNKTDFYASYGKIEQIPELDLPEIAFSGRSNVGKSSLINKIFNRKNLARVSSVPGKTATINFYNIDKTCFLVDLPGYGYAKIAHQDKVRWSSLIEGYLTADRELRLVMQLIDMRHPPSADDIQMINFWIETEQPFVIILTKADKLSKKQREERLKGFATEIPSFEDIEKVVFSAVNGEGVEQIRAIIEDVAQDN